MKDKTTKAKAAVTTTVNDTKTAIKNLERLIEAIALLIVAGYTLKQAWTMEHNFLFFTLMFSGVVIALRGCFEFLRHLANK